jgi:hypothetical protein
METMRKLTQKQIDNQMKKFTDRAATGFPVTYRLGDDVACKVAQTLKLQGKAEITVFDREVGLMELKFN